MNKKDLVKKLADANNITIKQASAFLDSLTGIISDELSKDEDVQISGFGCFESRKRAPRLGRNPRTGETCRTEVSYSATFKASAVLKKELTAARFGQKD